MPGDGLPLLRPGGQHELAHPGRRRTRPRTGRASPGSRAAPRSSGSPRARCAPRRAGSTSCRCPAIVHWEGNHWVVLYDVDASDHVRVADPARGLRRVARDEFLESWSGYAALIALRPSGSTRAPGSATEPRAGSGRSSGRTARTSPPRPRCGARRGAPARAADPDAGGRRRRAARTRTSGRLWIVLLAAIVVVLLAMTALHARPALPAQRGSRSGSTRLARLPDRAAARPADDATSRRGGPATSSAGCRACGRCASSWSRAACRR